MPGPSAGCTYSCSEGGGGDMRGGEENGKLGSCTVWEKICNMCVCVLILCGFIQSCGERQEVARGIV